jgi:hypothetical protein
MSNLYEVAQWMRPSDPAADALGRRLVDAATCPGGKLNADCANLGFRFLDDWYTNNWE